MSLEIIKSLFNKSFDKGTAELLIATDESLFIRAHGLDVLVTIDQREDEIYIDFDLQSDLSADEKLPNAEFPIFLNIDVIDREWHVADWMDNKALPFQDRVKGRFNQFIQVLKYLSTVENYRDALTGLLRKERSLLKGTNESKMIHDVSNKAKDFFKNKDYSTVVSLLNPYKDKLDEHSRKLLQYSIMKSSGD